MSKNTVTSKVENGNVLILERIFNAPRELVFEAHHKPEHLKNWWGPWGWELTHCEMDFRPGGSWHYCMTCQDKNQGEYFGMQSWGKAVYGKIVEPETIAYTDYFSDEDAKINDQLPATQSVTTLIDLGNGKTKLLSRNEYATAEALKAVTDMGMLEGTSQTWDRLEEFLEKQTKS